MFWNIWHFICKPNYKTDCSRYLVWSYENLASIVSDAYASYPHAHAKAPCTGEGNLTDMILLTWNYLFGGTEFYYSWRDGVVVGASASQSVDLGFNLLVESYQKTLQNGIHSFPTWRLAFRTCRTNKPTSSLVVSLGKALNGTPRLYVEDRWSRHFGNGNSQASADVPSKI